VAVALALLPAAGHGRGLGQIRSSSGLNQPFEGDIDLQSVSADEIPQVKVRLAPADAFAKAGVELTGPLGKLAFKPYVKANGQPAIRVSSQEPIQEPFLDFLIEVEWPQGKTVKEYTVLLDPPIFTERRGARVHSAEAARAPAPAGTPPSEPRVARVAPVAPTVAAPSAPAAGGERYGSVRRGETLWSIAQKTKPAGVSTHKALAAIYAANPHAFIRGDVNKLRAGAELRLPTPQEMGALDVQSARREYLEQAKQPAREGTARPGTAAPTSAAAAPESADRLRLVTPPPVSEAPVTTGAAASPAAAPGVLRQDLLLAQEKAESALQTAEQLQGRVADLETQLRDMQRLVLLKDEQLSQLQRQGRMAGTAAPTTPSAAAMPAAPVAPAPAETPVVRAHPPVTEAAPAVATVPVTPPPAETPVAPAPAAVPPAIPPTPAAAVVEAVPAPSPTPVAVEARPVEPAPAVSPEPAPAVAARPAEEQAAVSAPQPVAAPTPAAAARPAEPAPIAAAPPAPAAPPAAGGFAALLKDPASLIGVGIAGIGVLGALLWAIAGRRRKIEVAGVGPAAESAAAAPAPAAAPSAPPAEEKAARMEPLVAAAAVAGATVAAKAETVEPERVSTEDLAALELSTTDLFGLKGETTEVDPTEEADVYIAYGRYEQAEQLLRLALEMEPNRLALKHKLLEVYFASRDASAFSALFGEMKSAGKEGEDPAAWQRALRMGRQLNPGDPVFAGTAADEQDLEAALRAAEEGLAADLQASAPDLGPLKIDTHFSEAAPDLDGGSVLNDLSLDLGTEEHSDKGSHPFKLDVSEELSELRAPSSLTGELDDNDLSKSGGASGGFSLEEITGEDIQQAEDLAPDLSGIELTIETGGSDQDTTLMRADTTLELVDDVETKLDLARAYIELGDGEGARVMLREVLQEGNDAQKASAEVMLKELS
jgi:pilus assembly protein FimV